MTNLATHPAELGGCAKAIRQFHDIDARKQAWRTRRGVVLGILLTVLGGPPSPSVLQRSPTIGSWFRSLRARIRFG